MKEKRLVCFKKILRRDFVICLMELGIGLFQFFFNSLSTKSVFILLGCLMIVEGLYSLIKYFSDGFGTSVYESKLVFGSSGLVLGLFTAIYNFSYLNVVLGIWFLIKACCKLYDSFKLRSFDEEIYPLQFMFALLILIMGVCIIFNLITSVLIDKKIGLFLVIMAIVEFMNSMLYRRRAENLLEEYSKKA